MFIGTFAVAALLAAIPAANDRDAGQQGERVSYSSDAMCANRPAPGWTMTSRDNPDVTVIDARKDPGHSPTNDEINAAETGNPYSVDFSYSQQSAGGSGDLEALETENPDNARPGPIALQGGAATGCPR